MQRIDWIEVIVNWFPMLLLIGVWVFFLVRMRSGPQAKFQAEYLEIARRQTVTLERIASALEKQEPVKLP